MSVHIDLVCNRCQTRFHDGRTATDLRKNAARVGWTHRRWVKTYDYCPACSELIEQEFRSEIAKLKENQR